MSDFYGFEEMRFSFEGKDAVVVFANTQNRSNKWLLKTEYFGAFPELEVMMLKKGYNVAHVENTSRWCLEEDTERQARFCKCLHDAYGFAEKCVPVGMSCGGMQAIFLAAATPIPPFRMTRTANCSTTTPWRMICPLSSTSSQAAITIHTDFPTTGSSPILL